MSEAQKLTPRDEKLVDSVPEPDAYSSAQDRKAIEALKRLTKKQQLEVLKKLGVNEENPFTISGDVRARLLDVVAEVGFGVTSTRKGKHGLEISTPTGHGRGSGRRRSKR